jgi:hypothetical protein
MSHQMSTCPGSRPATRARGARSTNGGYRGIPRGPDPERALAPGPRPCRLDLARELAGAGRATPVELEADTTVDRFRGRSDPRIVAAVALLLAVAAIALEIAYVVGRFVLNTVEQIP